MSFLRFYRQYRIKSYLNRQGPHKLHLGAGTNELDGWLNTDLHPVGSMIYLNSSKPLPFPDASFDYIFSEHHLEQHTFPYAIKLLKECKRILKPDGILRIHTPDLEVLMNLHALKKTSVQEQYIRFIMDTFCGDIQRYDDELVINNAFYNFGHHFLWSERLLTQVLHEAGFKSIKRNGLQQSDHEPLRGIASHAKIIKQVAPLFDGDELNALETMAIEAI